MESSLGLSVNLFFGGLSCSCWNAGQHKINLFNNLNAGSLICELK